MASLKSSVIGIPSGKMGGVIVRIRNGKPFYYSLPLNFKMSMSAAAALVRIRPRYFCVRPDLPELD